MPAPQHQRFVSGLSKDRAEECLVLPKPLESFLIVRRGLTRTLAPPASVGEARNGQITQNESKIPTFVFFRGIRYHLNKSREER
jgi:hypothetical protein